MKTNESVKIYDNEDSLGLKMTYADGTWDSFGTKKEGFDDKKLEEVENYFDDFGKSVARYGNDMKHTGYQNGKADGTNEGFNAGILVSGVSLILGWLVCKYYDWKKENKK